MWKLSSLREHVGVPSATAGSPHAPFQNLLKKRIGRSRIVCETKKICHHSGSISFLFLIFLNFRHAEIQRFAVKLELFHVKRVCGDRIFVAV